MPISIGNTQAASAIQQSLSSLEGGLVQSYQRLASGLRINSASDDAASLSISEGLGLQSGSLLVAQRNANNAIGFAQTAEGSLAQQALLVTRMRDLAVQSMNGDLTATDRGYLNTEYLALISEVDRIATATTWNGTILLGGTRATLDFQVGTGTNASDRISVGYGASGIGIFGYSIHTSKVASTTQAQAAITALDGTLGTINSRRQEFGASINRLQVILNGLQSQRTNLMSANSRIRDVDVAEETSRLARTQVLLQGGVALLGQANQSARLALTLLGTA